MNILRICGSYFPAKKMGGAVTADFTLDSSLAAKGHKILVMTTDAGLSDYQNKRKEELEGVVIERFSYVGGDNFSLSFLMLLSIWRKLNSFDGVVIFSGIWNLPVVLGPLFCRLLSVPYIITPHGSLYPELIDRKKTLLKRLLLKTFVRSNVLYAKAVHFTVDSERIAAQSLLGKIENATVIPLGIPTYEERCSNYIHPLKHISSNCSLRIVLFVGRINWKKGIDLLIRALAGLSSELKSGVRLNLVGPDDPGEIQRLQSIASQCNLIWGRDIVWLGPLYAEDLESAYATAHIYALTSYSENFAVTVIEAAQHGLPIIMTQQVGVSTYFKNGSNAEIVSLKEEDITNSLATLLTDNAYAKTLGHGARVLSNEFTVERYSAEFFKVLNHGQI